MVKDMNYIEKCTDIISEELYVTPKYKEIGKIELSIVIPTYHRPVTIIDVLTSIQLQYEGENNIEVVVVDNEHDCDDNTLLHNLSRFSNIPLKYYRNQENIGMASNWNRCFELAKGEWVLMIHTDDLLIDGTLKYALEFIFKYDKKYDLLFLNRMNRTYKNNEDIASLTLLKQSPGALKEYNYLDVILGIALNAPTGMMCKKKVFLNLGGYNNDRKAYALDVDFSMRAMQCYKVGGATRIGVIKREGENDTSISTENYRISWVNSIIEIYDRYADFKYAQKKGFLYKMRMVSIARWASISITRLNCDSFKFSNIELYIYKIVRKVYMGISFRRF